MPGFINFRTLPLSYLSMPKAGCSTIKNFIYFLDYGRYLDNPNNIHGRERHDLLHFNSNPEAVTKRLRTDFVFTLVRHPIKRAYSCFNEKICILSKYSFPPAREFFIREYNADLSQQSSAEAHKDNFFKFLTFVRDTVKGNIKFPADFHWAPQMRVLDEAQEIRRIDFVGHLETLDEDFGFALRRSGLTGDYKVVRQNEGPPAVHPYDEIVDDRILALGEEIYWRDFKHLGYQPR